MNLDGGRVVGGTGPTGNSGDVSLVPLAVQIMRDIPYGFLISPGSPPTARLVQHLFVSDDAAVWIGTSPRSRKAQSIAADGTATYAVEDRTRFAYVSVSGPAVGVDDLEARCSLWEEGLRAFFPEGPDGDDFTLIQLVPDNVEVMSFADGVHPDPYGLVPAIAERRDDTWQQLLPHDRR